MLQGLEIPEIKETLKDVGRLVEFDERLKERSRHFSLRGRNQRNVDYINFFDLRWLLFYDAGSGPFGPKGYDRAASNFEKSSWGLLYEYAAVQRLLMHMMRPTDTREALGSALELCEHALAARQSPGWATTLWRIALLLARKVPSEDCDVTKLFRLGRGEVRDAPFLALCSPFKQGFVPDSVALAANGKEMLLAQKGAEVKEGVNNFPFVHYGKVNTRE